MISSLLVSYRKEIEREFIREFVVIEINFIWKVTEIMSESTENRLKAFLERNRSRISNNTHRSDNNNILSALDESPQKKIETVTPPQSVSKQYNDNITNSRKDSQERSFEKHIELIEKTIPTRGIEEMSFDYQPVSLFDVIGNVSYGSGKIRFSPKENSIPEIDFPNIQQNVVEKESQFENSPERPIERKLDKEFDDMMSENKLDHNEGAGVVDNPNEVLIENIKKEVSEPEEIKKGNSTPQSVSAQRGKKNFIKKPTSSISTQGMNRSRETRVPSASASKSLIKVRSNSSLDGSGFSKTSKNDRSQYSSLDPKKNHLSSQKSKTTFGSAQRQFSKTSLTKNSSASSLALTNHSILNVHPVEKKSEKKSKENKNVTSIEVYPESSRLLAELDSTTPNDSIFK